MLCLCELALFPSLDQGLLTFLDTVILSSLKPSMPLKEQSNLFSKCFLAISADKQLVVFAALYSGASFKDGKGFFFPENFRHHGSDTKVRSYS